MIFLIACIGVGNWHAAVQVVGHAELCFILWFLTLVCEISCSLQVAINRSYVCTWNHHFGGRETILDEPVSFFPMGYSCWVKVLRSSMLSQVCRIKTWKLLSESFMIQVFFCQLRLDVPNLKCCDYCMYSPKYLHMICIVCLLIFITNTCTHTHTHMLCT
jgi:hypothetical protein